MTLQIVGMTCASCVHAIESTLLKKPGVIAASVALTTNTGRFEFDPDRLGTRDIIESINDLGFQASIPSNDSIKAEALSHAKIIKQLVGISFKTCTCIKHILCFAFLRIFTGKKFPQIKLQRFRKV